MSNRCASQSLLSKWLDKRPKENNTHGTSSATSPYISDAISKKISNCPDLDPSQSDDEQTINLQNMVLQ